MRICRKNKYFRW